MKTYKKLLTAILVICMAAGIVSGGFGLNMKVYAEESPEPGLETVVINGFENLTEWTGTTAAEETAIKTEGERASRVTYAVPDTTAWINYTWNPLQPIDLSNAAELKLDIYPVDSQTQGANEPVVFKLADKNGGVINEGYIPKQVSGQWNTFTFNLQQIPPEKRGAIRQINFYVYSKAPTIEGRKQLTYIFDNMRISREPTVAPVSAEPPSSTVEQGTNVSLFSQTSGAGIYYTLDGTDPRTSPARTEYGGPITVSRDTVINAYAIMDGMHDSDVTTFYYFIGTTNPNQLFSDDFNDNIISSAWAPVGQTWIEDGQVLSQINSEVFGYPKKAILTGAGLDQSADYVITAKVRVDSWEDGDWARAGVGLATGTGNAYGYNLVFHNDHSTVQFLDDFVAWGPSYEFDWTDGTWYWFKLKEDNGVLYGKVWEDGAEEPSDWPYSWDDISGRTGYPSLVGCCKSNSSAYPGTGTVSFDDVSITRERVTPVTADPQPSAVAPGTEVTLSCATGEAKIYYTLDGTDPYTSDSRREYAGPIVIDDETVVKAYAVLEGMDDSIVSTFYYPLGTGVKGEIIRNLDKYIKNMGKETFAPVFKTDAVTIDGSLDDWAGNSNIDLPSDAEAQVKITGWNGAGDLSGKIGITYDDSKLYLGIKVRDDVHKALAGEEMWTGDSIQLAFSEDGSAYGPEYGFACVEGQPAVWCWNPGRAQLGKDSIDLAVRRDDDAKETLYEAAIPWAAILPSQPGDKLPFTLLINDNDGEGRRGYIEWTPGIGQFKDPGSFATLVLLREGEDWSSWMYGPKEAKTGEEAKFYLCIPNHGDRNMSLKISVPAADISEYEIAVPAGTIFQKEIPVVFQNSGEKVVTAEIAEEGGPTRAESVRINVVKSDADERRVMIDEMEAKLPELEELLSQCEETKLPVDYETVNYTVIKNFIQYGRDDIDKGYLSRAEYVVNQLEELYEEAAGNLNAYLAGEKTAMEVPRYVSGRPEIDGYSFIGDTRTQGTDKEERRPVFFTGYGHFGQVRTDIPQFGGYGTNIIQIEIGPSSTILSSGPLGNWNISTSGGSKAAFAADAAVLHSGNSSLKVANQSAYANNVYGTIYQAIAVKPNTTYHFSAFVKAENLNRACFTFQTDWSDRHYLPNGTYDWQLVEYEFTTGQNQTSANVRLITEDITEGLWVDDIELAEDGTANNLIVNGGFEERGDGGDYIISTAAIESVIMNTLEKAEENNIAVNLLLSPHYFPGFALQKWPELNINNSGFIKFSINAPKAREIEEAFLRTIIPLIKDYKSLQSVTLSNEPAYDTRKDPFAAGPWHEYLEGEYGSIDSLNECYGTGFASFEEIGMPSLYEFTPYFYDWVAFNDKYFSDWHKWMADIIHELAPDLPVQAKIMGNLTNAVNYGTDPEDFAQFCEINGNDGSNYLGQGSAGYFKKTMFYDLQSSLRRAPVFNSEDHIIPDRDTRYVPEQAIQVGTDLWQGAVHGRTASTIWVWERTYDSANDFAGSVLHRPDVVKTVGKVNLDLNRLSYEVTALQNADASAAILYSLPSIVYSSSGYFTAVEKAYEALSFSGQKAGFVSEKQIQSDQLSKYKLLVIPEATHVEAATLAGIKNFVDNGGKVVVLGNSSDSLSRDEHNKELSAGDREYILGHSNVIASSVTTKELRGEMLEILEELGAARVMLIDCATGEPVYGVEWFSTMYGGKLLVNIANYENAAKNILVKVDGKPADGFKELISGKSSDSAELTAESRNPCLLSITPKKPPLDMIFSTGAISLTGSSRIIGNTGTNSTEAGSVNFAWSTGIDGNLFIGPGADWTEVVKSARPEPRDNVTGEISGLPSAREYTLPRFPEFPELPGKGDLAAGGATEINESGSYNSINVAGQLTIDVGDEDVQIATSSLAVTGNGSIAVNRTGRGKLILYVADRLEITGNGRVNSSGSSSDAVLYYSGSGSVNVGGNAGITGCIFAEKAGVTISGSGSITGHIVTGGSEVNISGNAKAEAGVIYAPNAGLTLSGSAGIKGGAVVKSLQLTGNTRMIYDDSAGPEFFEQLDGSATGF